jgi:hypothetical protein
MDAGSARCVITLKVCGKQTTRLDSDLPSRKNTWISF